MVKWYFLIVAAAGGFGIGWLIHTVLAAKEFDELLWKTERDKQELINQFNGLNEEEK